MTLMEPGFGIAKIGGGQPLTAARLRADGVEPSLEAAIDAALATAGVRTTDVEMPDWENWRAAADDLMNAEGWLAQRQFLEHTNLLEPRHAEDIAAGACIAAQRVVDCRRTAARARQSLGLLLDQYDMLALPTLEIEPPRLGEPAGLTYLTGPFNLAGLPALALPLPATAGAPIASLQLVGIWCDEESLLARAAIVKQALLNR